METAIVPDQMLAARAAIYAGITRYRLQQLAVLGKVRTELFGGRIYYLREDLDRLKGERDQCHPTGAGAA